MNGKKSNGISQLNEQQETMRMEVVDLEYRARYWGSTVQNQALYIRE